MKEAIAEVINYIEDNVGGYKDSAPLVISRVKQMLQKILDSEASGKDAVEKGGGYYYDLFKFFNDEHGLILVDTEMQDIIHAVEKFNEEKRIEAQRQKNTTNSPLYPKHSANQCFM